MPVRSHRIPGGATVLIHTCEICGAPAPFGRGVHLRAALAARSSAEAVRLAGQWYCAFHAGIRAGAKNANEGNGQIELFPQAR